MNLRAKFRDVVRDREQANVKRRIDARAAAGKVVEEEILHAEAMVLVHLAARFVNVA